MGKWDHLKTGVTARGIPGKADDLQKFEVPKKDRVPTDLRCEFLATWNHIVGDTAEDPIEEYRFHPIRRWRFDVAFLTSRVAVELEGGVWRQGRHTRGSGMVADIEKYNAATLLGWRLLRYTCDDLEKRPEQVCEEVRSLLLRKDTP